MFIDGWFDREKKMSGKKHRLGKGDRMNITIMM